MADAHRSPLDVTVLYDPLCGWCYGATPSLRHLARQPRVSLALLATGLFAGSGARPMDDRFAAHAWSNDQRIQLLTGVEFSTRYRDRVLADRRARVDSGPATRALTAVALTAPAHELRALEAIQAARYRDGSDVTDPGVLAVVLRRLELTLATDLLKRGDETLDRAVATRTATARELLSSLDAHGVPTVVLAMPAGRRVLPSELLYGPPASLMTQLDHH